MCNLYSIRTSRAALARKFISRKKATQRECDQPRPTASAWYSSALNSTTTMSVAVGHGQSLA